MSALSVDDARDHLNITRGDYDGRIQETIDAAEAVLASLIGPLEVVQQTERVPGRRLRLYLPVAPAVALVSVTPVDDIALTLSDLYLDIRRGTVSRNDGGSFTARYYTVVYDAGRDPLPASLLMADKELVRHMWEGSVLRGGGKPGAQQSDAAANTVPGAEWLLPFRVTQLIAPYRPIGIA